MDATPEQPPSSGRVRITSPLSTAPAHVRRSAREEIDEETGVGEVYIRSLVRTQLRSALAVVTLLAVGIGSLPLAFTLLPGLARTQVGPVPLPWIVLGVLVYPALLLVGWVYVRRAERAEADFAALVEAAEHR
ncbi:MULTISPECIES: hypothetical protein [unclassified Aeromicrobium]|uniref:hypothetical protein n=1 Tax=unclassified Aeromicrobium TaxID=2633570 RepID=UPI0006F8D2EC|nr:MULTISPECIES: hypothetical protein [unclassified Aeromicrobium]KQO42174.1 hypothetical protein ASF05_14030 [Aeromicrobium sp. Leaf245]KQP29279.1 hypothetical protein ASF38_00420 [Aeromicrobium sp. Leaf272]KQP75567.1 hypothetical protein ASF37_15105 [Aeromicrobium sp. Leaf289]KQP81547.1 hypothetical protein ASF35_16065 [Aeromicrobium sp. Leaf291]